MQRRPRGLAGLGAVPLAVFLVLALAAGVPATAFATSSSSRRLRAVQAAGQAQGGTALLEITSQAGRAAPLFDVSVRIHPSHFNGQRGIAMVVNKDTRSLEVRPGVEGIASASLTDTVLTNGWAELRVKTVAEESSASNDIRMYSAGFLEGLLTARMTADFRTNLEGLLEQDKLWKQTKEGVTASLGNQLKHLVKKSNFETGPMSAEPPDPYWKQARYVLAQLWGVRDGYNFAIGFEGLKGAEPMELTDLIILNSHADLPEMMEAHRPEPKRPSKTKRRRRRKRRKQRAARSLLQRPAGGGNRTGMVDVSNFQVDVSNNTWTDALTDKDWERRLARHGHCSALVRLSPDLSELFVGHTTWSDYSKMLRVFKYYNFELPGSYVGAQLMGFSSYPGCVSSTDDFYMLDSGLLVMDTSLELLEPNAHRAAARPRPPVPNFVHLMAVNRFAQSAVHWTQLYSEQNSGTSSAQWIIVDYARFSPKKPPGENTLLVLEQIPGLTKQADLTGLLAKSGYWASYNRPFFHEMRVLSGHAAAEAAHGALFSFKDGPRAEIFGRIAPTVNGLPAMRALMDRNDFPNEHVQPNSPGHSISARLDLDPDDPIPNGGIDAKVTSSALFANLQCQATSGPSHEAQEVFRWTSKGKETFPGWPHSGLPNSYNFGWVQMTPSGAVALA